MKRIIVNDQDDKLKNRGERMSNTTIVLTNDGIMVRDLAITLKCPVPIIVSVSQGAQYIQKKKKLMASILQEEYSQIKYTSISHFKDKRTAHSCSYLEMII